LAKGKRVNNESIWWQDLMAMTHEQQLNNVLQNGRLGVVTKSDFGRTARLVMVKH